MSIDKKGVQIGEEELYLIALFAAKKQMELIDEVEGQYALFQAKDGAYHFVVAPAYYDNDDPRSLVKKMADKKDRTGKIENPMKEFLAKHKLALEYPNTKNLHTHYFLCQRQGTQHYVYGYVDNTGLLRIKDSFPKYKPNAHKMDIMQHIPKDETKKHRYKHTSAQYNSSDCGHYALYYFKQNIGAKQKLSFLNLHARKIGFVAGVLLVGTVLSIGLTLTGFAITPLIIGVSVGLAVLGGVIGSQWADVFDLTIHEERHENAELYQEAFQEQQALNEKRYGSNAAKALAKLPEGSPLKNPCTEENDEEKEEMHDKKRNPEQSEALLLDGADSGWKLL